MDIEKLKKINDINVLVFGDFMVDKYIDGSVNRISPEAPVPVIEVKKSNLKLGGAGNVINNIISLGSKVKVIGCVGKDEAGNFIINSFNNIGVNTDYFSQHKDYRTIIKTRVVSKNQQFLRIDEEKKDVLPNECFEFLQKNIDRILSNINVIIISDYAKGSVSYDSAQLIIKNARNKNIPVIIDPKGKDYAKYQGATIITPNLKELCDVTGKIIKTEEEIKFSCDKLIKELDLKYIMLTRSEKGITLINEEKKSDFPTVAKDVIDVSGAGDTVVATIATLISTGYTMEEICELANIAASVVVSKFGTSTVSLNELICQIQKTGKFKLIDLETAKYIVNDLKEKNKKVVFTNGCFDLLHVGHLSSFRKAKSLGDILIVAVNSDKSVKENKGDLRPIINENDRIEMISELECVDYVILMDDKNPSNLIKELKPNISVKGEDWKNKNVPEKEIIESYGGKIEFIKLEKDKSTTNIINIILKVYNEK